MSSPIEFQLDREVNALYIKPRQGAVARTIELTDSVHADVDGKGAQIGLEVVNADELGPSLHDHADAADTPPRIRALFRVTGV